MIRKGVKEGCKEGRKERENLLNIWTEAPGKQKKKKRRNETGTEALLFEWKDTHKETV